MTGIRIIAWSLYSLMKSLYIKKNKLATSVHKIALLSIRVLTKILPVTILVIKKVEVEIPNSLNVAAGITLV